MTAVSKTLNTAVRACAALLTASILSTTAFAADAPATIPTSFLGTYNLTYAYAQTGSPITNGTAVTVVIAANNTMCIGGYTLTNPVTRNGNGHEAIWSESTTGTEIALSSLLTGFNEINVGSSAGVWWGQLQGSKSSSSTTGCGSSTPATPVPDMTQINELFAQAQAKLAQYFPPSANASNQTLDDYIYRFYPSTGIYLAINNGEIYVMGGTFGDTPAPKGNIATILSELANMSVDIEVPAAAEGDYKLVVDGTFAVSTTGITLPPQSYSVTIDKIGAPSSTDIDDIREAVKEALKESGIDIVGTIDVSEVSSTSGAFSFRVAFTGTSSGATLVYNLLYKYTKL